MDLLRIFHFFFGTRLRAYFNLCVILPLLLAYLHTDRSYFRSSLDLHYDISQTKEVHLKLDTYWGPKDIVISPSLNHPNPFRLFQSSILSLTWIAKQDSPTPQLRIREELTGWSTDLRFSKESESKWVAINLPLERTSQEVGYLSGFWAAYWLIFSLFFWGLYFLRHRGEYWKEILFFLSIFSFLAYLLYLNWPGHLSVDSLYNFHWGLQGHNSPFVQIFYSSIHTGLLFLIGQIGAISVLNILLATLTVTYAYHRCRKDSRAYIIFAISVVMIFGSKINLHMSLLHNRDIGFSWLFVLFLLILSSHFEKRFTVGRGALLSVSTWIVFVLLCFLRKEMLALAPILALTEILLNRKNLWPVVGKQILVFGVLFYYYAGTAYHRDKHLNSTYAITAYVNPFFSILKQKGIEALSLEEREKLAHFVDIERGLEVHNEFDISEFHFGYVKIGKIGQRETEIFRNSLIRLALEHPGAYLKNRLKMSSAVLGFRKETYWYNDEIFLNKAFHPLQAMLPTAQLSDGPKAWAAASSARELLWYRFLLASALPALVISFIILLLFRRHPWTAFTTVIALTRVGVVLVLAPAGYYKYIWSFTLWCWLAPAIAVLEWHSRKQFEKGLQ